MIVSKDVDLDGKGVNGHYRNEDVNRIKVSKIHTHFVSGSVFNRYRTCIRARRSKFSRYRVVVVFVMMCGLYLLCSGKLDDIIMTDVNANPPSSSVRGSFDIQFRPKERDSVESMGYGSESDEESDVDNSMVRESARDIGVQPRFELIAERNPPVIRVSRNLARIIQRRRITGIPGIRNIISTTSSEIGEMTSNSAEVTKYIGIDNKIVDHNKRRMENKVKRVNGNERTKTRRQINRHITSLSAIKKLGNEISNLSESNGTFDTYNGSVRQESQENTKKVIEIVEDNYKEHLPIARVTTDNVKAGAIQYNKELFNKMADNSSDDVGKNFSGDYYDYYTNGVETVDGSSGSSGMYRYNSDEPYYDEYSDANDTSDDQNEKNSAEMSNGE